MAAVGVMEGFVGWREGRVRASEDSLTMLMTASDTLPMTSSGAPLTNHGDGRKMGGRRERRRARTLEPPLPSYQPRELKRGTDCQEWRC
jgi:hypothetical protein